MRGIAFWFFFTATLYFLAGMVWGIVMAVSDDHSLMPAHAHLNLVGGVVSALAGLYYHLVPKAGGHWLAKAHFTFAMLGILTMVPGIALALAGQSEVLAKVGSILTLGAMILFTMNVLKFRTSAEFV
ncbi:hypothetical protein [Rhizobium sp. BR 314]|uniref:hypothetical protein n=1 Tax=Rhizobium sp. BR 314 TaxID=3040013 RepID=UPI0039BFAFDE